MLKYIPHVVFIVSFINLVRAYPFQKCSQSLEFYENEPKVVETLNGQVSGECHIVPYGSSHNKIFTSDVYSWLGIPYAQAPTEDNRFMKPKPVNHWSGVMNTTNWPKKCIQSGTTDKNSTSEDCLYLNIFVRGNTFLKRYVSSKPVMVWIHGGSFLRGDSGQSLYEPSTLVASSDIIVVSFNYRLGALGFLSLEGTEATGNAGFLDQHMAIKWVYENIKYFGGDNTKITLAGQGAGAISVGYHLFHPESWPYFKNAIMQSGTPIGSKDLLTTNDATKRTNMLLNKLGCNNYDNKNQLICARNLNKELFAVDESLNGLVIDNVVFSESIYQLLRDGKFKSCNIIAGYNSHEFNSNIQSLFIDLSDLVNVNSDVLESYLKNYLTFNGYPIDNSIVEAIYQKYRISKFSKNGLEYLQYADRIQTDKNFFCPIKTIAEWFTATGSRAYVYRFEHQNEDSFDAGIFQGPKHSDEIPFLFGKPLSINEELLASHGFNYSIESKLLSEQIKAYWTSFVKFDDPNYLKSASEIDYWYPFDGFEDYNNYGVGLNETTLKRYALVFKDNRNYAIRSNFSMHQCDFWNMHSRY